MNNDERMGIYQIKVTTLLFPSFEDHIPLAIRVCVDQLLRDKVIKSNEVADVSERAALYLSKDHLRFQRPAMAKVKELTREELFKIHYMIIEGFSTKTIIDKYPKLKDIAIDTYQLIADNIKKELFNEH